MTGTQERAVAAMRAIGDTVTGAPPLRLPPHTAAAARFTRPAGILARRAWRLWLVPAAAAVAVVAIAVSLVLVRSAPRDSALPPGTATPSASGAGGPDGVPPYYVTLPASFGWYAYAPAAPRPAARVAGLVIGETATGRRLATVALPRGMTFNVVTGAADDRTFVVGATSYSPVGKTAVAGWSETWYLLRIAPGTAHVARLTRLPVLGLPAVTGAAISPDGTELAVAWQLPAGPSLSSLSTRPALAVFSLSTGRELVHWGTARGRITASPPVTGSRPGPFDFVGLATALRWTPDGRELAYAWNGTQIRLLDLTSPASRRPDLLRASTMRAGIGTVYTPAGSSFSCDAAAGWSLSAGATFTCAGGYTPVRAATGPGCGKAAPAHQAIIQQTALGGGAAELTTLAQSPACTVSGARAFGASLGWSAADGTRVIAMLGSNLLPREARFGVYAKRTFTALPALLSAASLATVAW